LLCDPVPLAAPSRQGAAPRGAEKGHDDSSCVHNSVVTPCRHAAGSVPDSWPSRLRRDLVCFASIMLRQPRLQRQPSRGSDGEHQQPEPVAGVLAMVGLLLLKVIRLVLVAGCVHRAWSCRAHAPGQPPSEAGHRHRQDKPGTKPGVALAHAVPASIIPA
jgi:hypothetical protein